MRDFKKSLCAALALALCLGALAGCAGANKEGAAAAPAGSGDVVNVDVAPVDEPEREVTSGSGFASVGELEVRDLREYADFEDDGASRRLVISIPESLPEYASPIANTYASPERMTEDEYVSYLDSVGKLYEALEWRTGNCFEDSADSAPAAVRTERDDVYVATGWDGYRYDGDDLVGLASQEASLFASLGFSYADANAEFSTTLKSGESIEGIDFAYYAEFFSAVLGREVDPEFLLSGLAYAAGHMVDSEYYEDMPERSVSVTFGDGEDEVSFDFDVFVSFNGNLSVGVSATYFKFFG